MFLNRKLPRIENIRKISISKMITFDRGPTENETVYRMACRPSALFARRTTLVTLSTLIILASYGATAKNPPLKTLSRNFKRTSKMEATTTKKSNLFQPFLK